MSLRRETLSLRVEAAGMPACRLPGLALSRAKPSLRRRSHIQSHLSTGRAAINSMVIVPDKVSVGASSVARSASSGRASTVVGSDSKADLGELRAGAHIDDRKIPEDGVSLQGIFVLEDINLFGLHGHLDGDSTAVGIGAPALSVAGTGLKALHGTVICADLPVLDGVLHVVVDVDIATVTASVGSAVGGSSGGGGVGISVGAVYRSRSSRGESAKGSEETESLGEIHV
ncbi:hypothetical protein EIK77_003425 [Talaromyces pinophilus]|nr:hypothetical protein EIK77_003425 [Talaromyces pinophilus]